MPGKIPGDNGDWKEYRRLVLDALAKNDSFQQRLLDRFDKLEDGVENLRIEAGKMTVRASVWGTLGGIISALTVILMGLIMHFFR